MQCIIYKCSNIVICLVLAYKKSKNLNVTFHTSTVHVIIKIISHDDLIFVMQNINLYIMPQWLLKINFL